MKLGNHDWMPGEIGSGKPQMVTVKNNWAEFTFYRPQASAVHLAGDFNDWRVGEVPMVRGPKGYWMARMRLPAGEFRFRYCADGEWYTDFAAFGVTPGRFGLDSVLRVVAEPLRIVEPAAASPSEIAAA